jgi:hypothetical protein
LNAWTHYRRSLEWRQGVVTAVAPPEVGPGIGGDMALEEYNRKRDFAKTPEPRPGRVKARKEGLSYLVQKHDATRLHFDRARS